MHHIVKLLLGKKYISGNEIGGILGISADAVHKMIKSLINNGFIIDSSSKGYRLAKNAPVFNKEDVFSSLPRDLSVCKKIFHFKKIDSTQIKLKNLAENGKPEGIIVIADEQRAAYGRMRRPWSSAAGGLWFSMLLKPKILPEKAPLLALLTGIALNRILRRGYGVKTKVKWPNDILFGYKKLAGIIIEMCAGQNGINWAAAGIGINMDNFLPEDLNDAVSLNSILGKSTDRAKFLALFLTEFDIIYKEFQNAGFKKFAGEYNKNTAFMKENVIIDNGFDIIKGVNKGINEEGNLIIKTKNGFEEILSGTLRRI
ncbi:MAG: biotin--[acetyl-CoA-carboxylase] ligase [Endomicrobia bacterium]|nr:biotin--[acetyl-CoA-carboxylase] ligase [Endomicrobiia bacterium]